MRTSAASGSGRHAFSVASSWNRSKYLFLSSKLDWVASSSATRRDRTAIWSSNPSFLAFTLSRYLFWFSLDLFLLSESSMPVKRYNFTSSSTNCLDTCQYLCLRIAPCRYASSQPKQSSMQRHRLHADKARISAGNGKNNRPGKTQESCNANTLPDSDMPDIEWGAGSMIQDGKIRGPYMNRLTQYALSVLKLRRQNSKHTLGASSTLKTPSGQRLNVNHSWREQEEITLTVDPLQLTEQ